MTLENNPSYGQFARWFLNQPEVIGEVKLWFGKEFVNLVAEIDEDEKRVYLKDCEKCDLPKIIHKDLNSPTCIILKCTQTNDDNKKINDILKTLTSTQENKEGLNVALFEEIEKMPEFEQTKTLLEELKTRTCICKKVCLNERGLQVHKRKCDVSKNALTREPSTASSTNENNMMLQLINQMKEDLKYGNISVNLFKN